MSNTIGENILRISGADGAGAGDTLDVSVTVRVAPQMQPCAVVA
jgi:hypothetical protein